MITVSEFFLPNGLKVKYLHAPDDPTFNIVMNVGIGARDETSGSRGICHLLEHAMYKGSSKFPDSIALSREMGKYGGSANGETNYEYHQFDFTGDADELLSALELFADFFFTPQFNDLEKEKEVVLEELYGFYDSIDDDIAFAGIRTLFPEQKISREICGTEETVRSFTKKDLEAWRARYYSPEHCILTITGKHFPEQVFQKAALFGGKWNYLRNEVKREDLLARRGIPRPRKKEINLLHSPDDQFAGSLNFALLNPTPEEYIDLGLLSDLLDDDDVCSRLQANIREEGLVYDISVGFDCLSDVLVTSITWEVSEEKLVTVCEKLTKELLVLTKDGISAQDFEYYRQRRLFKNKVACQHLEDRLEHELVAERIPYFLSIEAESEEIKKRTPADLSRTLQKCIIGPTAWTIRGEKASRFRRRLEKIA